MRACRSAPTSTTPVTSRHRRRGPWRSSRRASTRSGWPRPTASTPSACSAISRRRRPGSRSAPASSTNCALASRSTIASARRSSRSRWAVCRSNAISVRVFPSGPGRSGPRTRRTSSCGAWSTATFSPQPAHVRTGPVVSGDSSVVGGESEGPLPRTPTSRSRLVTCIPQPCCAFLMALSISFHSFAKKVSAPCLSARAFLMPSPVLMASLSSSSRRTSSMVRKPASSKS